MGQDSWHAMAIITNEVSQAKRGATAAVRQNAAYSNGTASAEILE